MGPRLREVKTQPGNRLALLVEAVESRPEVPAVVLCEGPNSRTFLQTLFELLEYTVKTCDDLEDYSINTAATPTVVLLLASDDSLGKLKIEKPPVLYIYDPVNDFSVEEAEAFRLIFQFKLIRSAKSKPTKVSHLVLTKLEKLVKSHYALRHTAEEACLEFYKLHYSDELLRTSIHKSFLLPTAIRPPSHWKTSPLNHRLARTVKTDQTF